MSKDKKKISELERELKLLSHYVFGYGNADKICEYGYPQHPGYICGMCRHDDSHGGPCPKVRTKSAS